MAYFLFGLYM